MDTNILIRPEIESDFEAISEITRAAFAHEPHSAQTEQFIIHALRRANALTLSLVAVGKTGIVGHIAFSPVTISDDSTAWYGLGPISVVPELQRQGIGKALMHEGLTRLKALGAKGCILVGDPGYYTRFGFRCLPQLKIEAVPPENLLTLPFEASVPSGTVAFHESFGAKE